MSYQHMKMLFSRFRFHKIGPLAGFWMLLAVIPNASQATSDDPRLYGDNYDPDNLIARTVRGDIPSVALYEDDEVVAFLADRPATLGHFLVASKTSKARNFLELTRDELAHIMEVAQRVAKAEIIALGTQGFTIRQNNGSASTIMQYHLHVIPRWKDDTLPQGMGKPVDMQTLEKQGEQIRAAME